MIIIVKNEADNTKGKMKRNLTRHLAPNIISSQIIITSVLTQRIGSVVLLNSLLDRLYMKSHDVKNPLNIVGCYSIMTHLHPMIFILHLLFFFHLKIQTVDIRTKTPATKNSGHYLDTTKLVSVDHHPS